MTSRRSCVERRVLARFEREAARRIPLCPTRDLRDVIYGFRCVLAPQTDDNSQGR